ncbi:MAG: hypothetical protein H0W72_18135 [Planctomycetes bacterium]|nr:hypothetical protein [Planctomycetota bacterium]
MSYRSLRSLARPALILVPALAGLTPLAHGVEGPDGRFLDLRASITSSPAPEISERITGPATPAASYDWKDVDEQGFQVTAGLALGSKARWWGGTVLQADLVFASYDITPGSLRRSDGVSFSPAASGLKYRTLGGQLAYGYHWASTTERDQLAAHFEFSPFIGAGMASAETSGQNSLGNAETYEDTSMYYEYGVRTGFYLTERGFLFGLTAFYAAGGDDLTIDLGGGASSELTLDREGFGAGLQAGWRF